MRADMEDGSQRYKNSSRPDCPGPVVQRTTLALCTANPSAGTNGGFGKKKLEC